MMTVTSALAIAVWEPLVTVTAIVASPGPSPLTSQPPLVETTDATSGLPEAHVQLGRPLGPPPET